MDIMSYKFCFCFFCFFFIAHKIITFYYLVRAFESITFSNRRKKLLEESNITVPLYGGKQNTHFSIIHPFVFVINFFFSITFINCLEDDFFLKLNWSGTESTPVNQPLTNLQFVNINQYCKYLLFLLSILAIEITVIANVTNSHKLCVELYTRMCW